MERYYIDSFECAYFGLNSSTGNKKTLNFNGKTKDELIKEAFRAVELYNNDFTPQDIKYDIRIEYIKSRKYKYVCYYTYSNITDEVTLSDKLKVK